MTCGHRGLPYRMEEKRVSRLLRKSGFIPMLEEKHENTRKPKVIAPENPMSQSTQHPPITPMKQEYNENRLSAKKETSVYQSMQEKPMFHSLP